MTARALLLCVLVTLFVSALPTFSAFAGEARIDGATGRIAPVEGYGNNADAYLQSPQVEIIVNEYVFECPLTVLSNPANRFGTTSSIRFTRDCDTPKLREPALGGPTLRPEERERILEHLEQATAAIEDAAVRGHGDRYTRSLAPAYRFDGKGGVVDPQSGMSVYVTARYHNQEPYGPVAFTFASPGG